MCAFALAWLALDVARAQTPASRSATDATPTLAITNVTLIDGTGAAPRPGVTVLVSGTRISGIVADGAAPHATAELDGRGKYLIPGLCDGHAHFRHGDRTPELFVAHGVTCVRQMFDDMAQLRTQRSAIAKGQLLGPRMLTIAGGWPDSAGSREERIADSLVAEGATFFKIGTTLTTASYEAVRRQARRHGVDFLGHLPVSVSLAEAVISGQRSIEHLALFELAFAPDESRLRDSLAAAFRRRDAAARDSVTAAALAGVSEARRDSLLRLLAARRVWVTPTLVNHRRAAMAGDSAFDVDPRLRDIPERTRAQWRQSRYRAARTPEQRALARALFAFQEKTVARMYQLGVPLIAGSDAGDVYNYDGSSLHDELRLFVAAGVPTIAALAAATSAPVSAAGALDSLGTVEVGKLADLVLLDANPLADIGNVGRISAVVVGGRVIDREEIRQLRESGSSRLGQASDSATARSGLLHGTPLPNSAGAAAEVRK